jgi:hypothetical protein
MKLTGTMWIVKSKPTWGNITARPSLHTHIVQGSAPIVGALSQGDTVLVISEPSPVPYELDSQRHQTAVQVLTPVPGWINSAYFVHDSLWLERLM